VALEAERSGEAMTGPIRCVDFRRSLPCGWKAHIETVSSYEDLLDAYSVGKDDTSHHTPGTTMPAGPCSDRGMLQDCSGYAMWKFTLVNR
jgi:hypothetical protein